MNSEDIVFINKLRQSNVDAIKLIDRWFSESDDRNVDVEKVLERLATELEGNRTSVGRDTPLSVDMFQDTINAVMAAAATSCIEAFRRTYVPEKEWWRHSDIGAHINIFADKFRGCLIQEVKMIKKREGL